MYGGGLGGGVCSRLPGESRGAMRSIRAARVLRRVLGIGLSWVLVWVVFFCALISDLENISPDITRRPVGWRSIARPFLEVFASDLHACDESILTRITSDYQVYTCG